MEQKLQRYFHLLEWFEVLAPTFSSIGAFIVHFLHGKLFLYFNYLCFTCCFFVYKDLPESYTYSKQNVMNLFKLVLSHKTALKAHAPLGFSFGGFFIIIAKTSFIYIEYFKIQTDYFPFFWNKFYSFNAND